MTTAKVAFLASSALVLTGCPNIASRTTAKTIGDGTNQVWFAVEAKGVTVDNELDPVGASTIDYSNTHWPSASVGYRRGILDYMEAGGALLSGLNEFYFDYKLNFVDSEYFAMAVDPGFGFVPFEDGPAKVGFVQFDAPLLIDVAPLEWLTITMGPKYMGVNYFRGEDPVLAGRSGFQHWVAGTLYVDLRVSELFGVGPYAALAYYLSSPVDQSVILNDAGVALSFRFGGTASGEPQREPEPEPKKKFVECDDTDELCQEQSAGAYDEECDDDDPDCVDCEEDDPDCQ